MRRTPPRAVTPCDWFKEQGLRREPWREVSRELDQSRVGWRQPGWSEFEDEVHETEETGRDNMLKSLAVKGNNGIRG